MMGDDFQSRLFWLYGSMLFLPERHVTRVQVESIEGGALDDIVVDYSLPLEDSGSDYTREYIQCKFHVADAKTYSSEALCDASFFSTKKSFLQRAYEAYEQYSANGLSFLLVLASNGDWDSKDKLKHEIADSGALREKFFTGGGGSALGKIRASWCDHLGLSTVEAEPFFRSLRLRYRWLDQRGLLHSVDAHARLIGLQPVDTAHSYNAYDGVYRAMIENGWLDFDRNTFSELCERQGLGTPCEPSVASVRAAGIRSFARGANYMDLECEPFVCLCEYFDGRAIRDPATWNGTLSAELRGWCESLAELPDACELRLECHCSIATAAGCMIGSRPRGTVLPAQGAKVGGSTVWRPDDGSSKAAWGSRDVAISDTGDNLAVALAITYDIEGVVTQFLHGHPELSVSTLRVYVPTGGPGHTAIANGSEGWGLASELNKDIARCLDENQTRVMHLFTSAPNALNFLMGRFKRPGDTWQTWEHNADGSLPEDYVMAIRIQ
jgi:hypothetical protein